MLYIYIYDLRYSMAKGYLDETSTINMQLSVLSSKVKSVHHRHLIEV
jgi:hypothetical protein